MVDSHIRTVDEFTIFSRKIGVRRGIDGYVYFNYLFYTYKPNYGYKSKNLLSTVDKEVKIDLHKIMRNIYDI